MFRPLASTLLAVSPPLLTACGDDGSCEIPSAELSVVALATATQDELRVEVDFDLGDRTLSDPVRLCDDDRLTINGAGVTETSKFDRIVYSRSYAPQTAPGQLEFELERTGEGETIAWSVSLPAEFSITQPAPSQRLPRSAPITIGWEPPRADGDIQLSLLEDIGGGICVETPISRHDYKGAGGISVADTGQWTIPADTIVAPERLRICAAEFRLTRTRVGAYPEALHPSGYVHARTQRRVPVALVP